MAMITAMFHRKLMVVHKDRIKHTTMRKRIIKVWFVFLTALSTQYKYLSLDAAAVKTRVLKYV